MHLFSDKPIERPGPDSPERIVIGRCFKDDTERLEKLFGLYATMTATEADRDATGAMPTATAKPEVNP